MGADYGGFVVRDGWAPYRKFEATISSGPKIILSPGLRQMRRLGTAIAWAALQAECRLLPVEVAGMSRWHTPKVQTLVDSA